VSMPPVCPAAALATHEACCAIPTNLILLLQDSAGSKVQEKAPPPSYPKPFDPEAPPARAMLDVLRHNDSRAALQGPVPSQAARTQAVQKERKEGGKKGSDSSRKCLAAWKLGRPWLEFGEVEVADVESEGCFLLVHTSSSAA